MKLIIITIIILLLVILVINRKNETFMDDELKARLLRGIALNMGEIENINSLKISSVPDSEKLLIENIIKNYSVKNLIFKNNIDLVNYTNIIGPDGKNANPNKMELLYTKRPLENVHNIPVCFAIGPDFKTNKKNPYYGIQMKYRIHDNSFANRAEIGIEYKSYKDISLGKLMEMNNRFKDEDYKKMKRKRVEAIGPDTKKFEFLPYFRDSDIEALLLFKDSKNEDFLEESEGYFNLNDERGNRILTKCKIDNPYCNVHLPQKGKIYGRDNYIATKFYPYNDNFRVIRNEKLSEEEIQKIEEIKKKMKEDEEKKQSNKEKQGELRKQNNEGNNDETDNKGFKETKKIYTAKGKCGLRWDSEKSAKNERNAKWDCTGNADPILIEGDKIYTYGPNNEKCGLEWHSVKNSKKERNAKWDCAGNADPISIEGDKIYTYGPNSEKCGLEWHSVKNSKNERNAKWDCTGKADPISIKSTGVKNNDTETKEPKIRNGVVTKVEWIALPERNIQRNKGIRLIDDERYLPGAGLVLELENKEGRDVSDYVIVKTNFDKGTLRGSPYGIFTPGYGYREGDLLVGYQKTPKGGVSYNKKIMTQNRDKFIFRVTGVKNNVTEGFIGGIVKEGFVGDFQDTSELPKEDQLPPLHDFYKKYLTKKDCVNEKEKLIRAIKNDEYLEEKEVNLVASKEELESLQRLRGSRCIKHFDKYRNDYFFGGFDKDNKMFCYGKDQDCIMFPSKDECEKMDLNTLLSIPEEELVKGLKNSDSRDLYDDETIDMLTETLKAEKEEKDDGYEVKCGTGKYLEGTFNPEDEIQIVGGYYKNCSDPHHPEHENCNLGPSPSASYHLSELITTKGRKKYNPSKTDKYSKFGDLDGECIDNNVPEGRMEECDPLDDFQPCYVGDRPGLVPGESVSNSDKYNKYLGYNCHTYTLPTNTCKHNNQGILSDVISFTNQRDNDYLDLINNQQILEMSQDYDFNMLNDEEKYRAKNLFLFMEKYIERYEDMSPRNHMNLRYSMKFESYYDLISKTDEIVLNVYHNGKKEATLNTNQGEIHYLQDGDIIEILIQKDNHLIFKVINPATKLVSAQYVTKEKIEGEFGSEINFYVSQNNNSFLRDFKYKDEIPKMVLPYNPFIDITQL